MRRRLGDTYLVDAFGCRLFCVFSPVGVRALYALREDEASFAAATVRLPTPARRHLGAVARAAGPCLVAYRARGG